MDPFQGSRLIPENGQSGTHTGLTHSLVGFLEQGRVGYPRVRYVRIILPRPVRYSSCDASPVPKIARPLIAPSLSLSCLALPHCLTLVFPSLPEVCCLRPSLSFCFSSSLFLSVAFPLFSACAHFDLTVQFPPPSFLLSLEERRAVCGWCRCTTALLHLFRRRSWPYNRLALSFPSPLAHLAKSLSTTPVLLLADSLRPGRETGILETLRLLVDSRVPKDSAGRRLSAFSSARRLQ